MKRIVLLLLLAGSFTANGQKLKDLLYGGKLKNDSGTVIRKTDDLSTKIDTNSKKRADSVNLVRMKMEAASKDSASSLPGAEASENTKINGDIGKREDKPVAKDNNRIWKEYMDSVAGILKTELLPDKKIKKGTYFITIDYVIELDGQVTISNVLTSPESKFLQEQIKERLISGTPQLNPVLLSTGKPRKVMRKYNFSLAKE